MNALALSLLVCAGGGECVLLPQFEATAFIDAIGTFGGDVADRRAADDPR